MYGCIGLACAAFDAVARFFSKFGKAFFAFFETLFCQFFKFVVFFARAVGMMSDALACFVFKTIQTLFGGFEFFLQFGFGFFTFFRAGFHTFGVQLFNIVHYILNVFQQSFFAGFKIMFFHYLLLDVHMGEITDYSSVN